MARESQIWPPILNAPQDEWRATPFYRTSRSAVAPAKIAQWGADPRDGDVRRGKEILSGQWRIATEKLNGVHPIPWSAPHPSSHFTARLHSFSWLVDVAAVGPEAHSRMAQLVERWLLGFGQWHESAWAPELTAERLYAWLCHGRPVFEALENAERASLLQSFAWQAHHLLAAWKDLREPSERIKAGAALTLCGLAVGPEAERVAYQGVEILEEACASQFHPDGGHLSRAPETLAEILYDLLTVDEAMTSGGLETPRLLKETLSRGAKFVRLLRLGDEALASFHGGAEGCSRSLDAALGKIGAGAPAFRFATQSGYQQLEGGDARLVMDVGAPPPPAHGGRAHASALAFEMSCGRARFIVNVGAQRELAPDWRAAARATNGHSTLVVDDELSMEFSKPRRGRAVHPLDLSISSKRTEEDDGVNIEARHEGYRSAFGFVHRRFLFMDKQGKNLRGADELGRPFADGRSAYSSPIPFAIRFHLHPGVRAEWSAPREPKLTLPNGAVWRLRTDAVRVSIEDSIYLSGRFAFADKPRIETAQIVLSGAADPNGVGDAPPNRVRWALTRIV